MSEKSPTDKEKEAPLSQSQIDYDAGKEFLEKGEKAQAANAFHNALLGFEKDNDESGIANASDKLGDLCLENNDFDQALSHWQSAYDICQKTSDRLSLFSIEKKRAKLYWQWKNYEEAISRYLKIIDEYYSNNDPQGTVDTLETLSNIYLESGDKVNAADCLRTAASIHKRFKHNNFHDRLMKKAKEIENN